MSLLTDFYCNNQSIPLADGKHYTLKDMLNQDDTWWEDCHNHIQWLFPTNKPSMHNKNAPILSQMEAITIATQGTENFYNSIVRFHQFLKQANMTYENHNYLRVTRAIESAALICGPSVAFRVMTILNKEIRYRTDKHCLFFTQAVHHNF